MRQELRVQKSFALVVILSWLSSLNYSLANLAEGLLDSGLDMHHISGMVLYCCFSYVTTFMEAKNFGRNTKTKDTSLQGPLFSGYYG